VKVGRPAVAINLHFAMQELVESDPWLDEPADEDLRTELASVESEPTFAW
jgi:hypothetical protein